MRCDKCFGELDTGMNCYNCQNKSASAGGSNAHLKPASDYTDEGLVQLALEVYARAATYMNKELHERAMEAKLELLKRLKIK